MKNKKTRSFVLISVSATVAIGIIPFVATAAEGSAEWEYVNPDSSRWVVSIEVYDDAPADLSFTGTQPPSTEFPIEIENSNDEVLVIELISGSKLRHTGKFPATWDPATSACAGMECDDNDYCTIPDAQMDCEEIDDGCIDYLCGNTGGVSTVAVDFVATIPYEP